MNRADIAEVTSGSLGSTLVTIEKALGMVDRVTFFRNDMLEDVALDSLSENVGAMASGAADQSLLEMFYRMPINPNTMSVNRKKLTKKDKTAAGWEVAMGGNEMIEYSFKGNTGYLALPSYITNLKGSDNIASLARLDNIMLNPRYYLLMRFHDFYDKSHQDHTVLTMIYDMQIIQGHLTSLEYSRNAEEPYRIDYSYKFMAYPDTWWRIESIYPPLLTSIFDSIALVESLTI
jgi:hypothetical protein